MDRGTLASAFRRTTREDGRALGAVPDGEAVLEDLFGLLKRE